MTWSVEWHPVAENDLRRIPWRDAERIAAAVLRFAERGEGGVEWVAGEPGLMRLRTLRATALFFADRAERVLRVWRVLAR